MKKTLLLSTLILTLGLTSCEKDDETPVIKKEIAAKINPPSWIQGKWEMNKKTTIKGFQFTSSDFCQTLLDSDVSCYAERIFDHNNALLKNTVEEEFSATKYDVKINLNNKIVEYHFEKINDKTIHWNILDKNDPGIVKTFHILTRK